MDSLEQLVTDTLGEHAAHAPEFRLTGRSLIWRVDVPRRRRPWGRWIGSAITVAAVTLFAVSLSLGWWSLNGSETASNGAAQLAPPHAGGANGGARGTSGTAPSAPADGSSFAGPTRRISYHGITLEVPAALPVIHSAPCGPASNRVVALDPTLLSGCADDPHGTASGSPASASPASSRVSDVVWLAPTTDSAGYGRLATGTETLDGRTVRIGFGRVSGTSGVSGALVVPSGHLVVGATFPTRAEVTRILDSLTFGSIDPRGCAAVLRLASATNGGTAASLSLNPTRATVCAYEHAAGPEGEGNLLGSSTLTRDDARRLARIFSSLPSAKSTDSVTASPMTVVVTFHYATGPSMTLVETSTPRTWEGMVDVNGHRSADPHASVQRFLRAHDALP